MGSEELGKDMVGLYFWICTCVSSIWLSYAQLCDDTVTVIISASSLTCKIQNHEFGFDCIQSIMLLLGQASANADKIPSMWEASVVLLQV